MTIAELAKLVATNSKSNKWLSAHFDVEHNGEAFKIGVKSFGLWVQRIEVCGIVSNVPEQKTQKRFRELFESECIVCLKSLGA